MRLGEIEKIVLADGWTFKTAKGSHRQYVHPAKPGKVTIPAWLNTFAEENGINFSEVLQDALAAKFAAKATV